MMLNQGDDIPESPSAKISLLCHTAMRKGLISEENKLTMEGKNLLAFLDSPSEETYVKQKRPVEEFDRWWKAYPGTDTFTHKGKSFTGTRSMRVKKDECKLKLNKILSEGEYTIDDLIAALEFEVLQKKENSVKAASNKLSFMQNSLTYLNQRTFEPFVELIREGQKVIVQNEPPKTFDI